MLLTHSWFGLIMGDGKNWVYMFTKAHTRCWYTERYAVKWGEFTDGLSLQEKIKRAEEIYARRQEGAQKRTSTVTVNNENRKDIKLLKKMIIQIIVT